MTRILAVLLLAGLAGCIEDGTSGPSQEPAAVEPPFLQVLTRISESDGGGEPSLGVSPDGVWYTNIYSDVYRSDDEGHTWQNLGDPAAPIPNNDPDLAVDRDGVIWESRLYALACNEVSVSQDGGATWTTAPVVCNGPVGDRQYVVPTQDCTAYLYWHQIPTFYQTVMKSTDCGLTWLPTGPAETPDGHLLVTEGSSWGGGGFHNDVTGSTYLTYTRNQGVVDGAVLGEPARPGTSITRDGLLWEESDGPDFDGTGLGLSLVVGAADDAGNAYLAWGENMDGDVGIFVTRSTDDGLSWESKIRIDAPDTGSHVFPAIAAGADGHVAVAYYQSEDESHPDTATNWTVELAWTDAYGSDWNYERLSDGIVKSDPICISGTTCTSGREFLDYFALERGPDGRVGAAFNELTDDGLRNWFALTEPILGPWPAA
ncbi:MAG: sialidase family protein [Thermoplasmatota archaeon]